MFPYRDENETQRTPYITFTIIALNVITWLFFQGAGQARPLAESVCNRGLIAGELTGTVPPGTRLEMDKRLVCYTDAGSQPLNLITSMFLHGSWMHLLGNMWFLWIFGNNVEDSMGHARFVVFYLISGFAPALLQVFMTPTSVVPMVGASGAISGIMGAYVVLYPRVRVHMLVILGFFITRIVVPAYVMLGYWFLIQILGGLPSLGQVSGGVAFWAHVGGFAAGALLVLVFRDPRLMARHPAQGWRSA